VTEPFNFPTDAELIDALQCERDYFAALEMPATDREEGWDVRLCCNPGEQWTLRSGPVDYDTDHTLLCSAAVLHGHMSDADLADVAHDLLETVMSDAEMMEEP